MFTSHVTWTGSKSGAQHLLDFQLYQVDNGLFLESLKGHRLLDTCTSVKVTYNTKKKLVVVYGKTSCCNAKLQGKQAQFTVILAGGLSVQQSVELLSTKVDDHMSSCKCCECHRASSCKCTGRCDHR